MNACYAEQFIYISYTNECAYISLHRDWKVVVL